MMKFEVIKEFAERLIKKMWFNGYNEWIVGKSDIDNLVKEMAGESDGKNN